MSSPIPIYRLYRERSGESGDFWLHCETIPERTHLHNWEIAVHRHNGFFQIFSLTAGHGELTGGPAPLAFEAPCMIFVPPGAAHGFRFAREIDGLVVTALADRLASHAAAEPCIADLGRAARILAAAPRHEEAEAVSCAVERIHRELSGRGAGRSLILEALMPDALVNLARMAALDTPQGGSSERDHRRLSELQALIGTHFREQRPVAFYAERLGISAAQLNRIARRGTGSSVQEMIAARILAAARRDLVFTPTPVQAIALSLGFSDPAYFNRFFRRRTGTTPGRFREAERGMLAA